MCGRELPHSSARPGDILLRLARRPDRRGAMRLGASSVVIMALAAAAAEPAGAADLSGFQTKCSGSDAFVRYMFSLGEKYTITGDRRRKVAVPADFKGWIGKQTVTDKGKYVAVSVPLKGTYRDLPVSRLYFELAHETHHYVAAVVFDAPLEEVK